MKTIVGIDEAGRGPLAGPVAVGAVSVRQSARAKRALLKAFPRVKDSKQLSEKQRNERFAEIKKLAQAGHLSWAVSFSSAHTIDKKGIVRAIAEATARCLHTLGVSSKNTAVLLDGGLKAPLEYAHQQTIIRGDATHLEIALASVCAKVLRDRKMVSAGKRYPQYGFEVHKGYGTQQHMRAVKKHGLSPLHRKTFCRRLA